MEIERKFLIRQLPGSLSSFQCLFIEQAYLCTDPVVRIRRQDGDFYLTYKGRGLMAREEYNLPLNDAAYAHLLAKSDGHVISKKRYLIPIEDPTFSEGYVPPGTPFSLQIELDIFEPPFAPLILAEVEFPDEEMAGAFLPPQWLGEDVTNNRKYHNSAMSQMSDPRKEFAL